MGLHSSEMMNVMEDREVWRLNLELLPPNPHGKAGNEERKERMISINLKFFDFSKTCFFCKRSSDLSTLISEMVI